MKHGQQFREAAYREAGLTRPSPWALGGAPRTITLLSAVVGEMVGLNAAAAHKQNLRFGMGAKALHYRWLLLSGKICVFCYMQVPHKRHLVLVLLVSLLCTA